MNVVFVYPDIGGMERYGARKLNHGLASVAGVLRKAGHTANLLCLHQEPTHETFLNDLMGCRPALVAFSSTTHQHPYVERCAEWIKRELPGVLTMAGGVHPTLAPEMVAHSPAIDVICVGEGEYPLCELADRLEAGESYADVPNLWTRVGRREAYNPLRPLITDLDALPFVDRELFRYDETLAHNGGRLDMLAGRGCPHRCSYCCNPALMQRYRGLGRYVRLRSVGHVLAEIAALTGRHAVQSINFQDDLFTLDRRWTLEFCQRYAGRFSYPFWINTRVEQILDEEVVEALASAGCEGVRLGVESGNEALRRRVLNRPTTNAQIRQAAGLVRRHGLRLYTCNMLGMPDETPAMADETIALNRELAPDDLQFSICYPYPMTALHERAQRDGLLKAGTSLSSYYERQSVMDLPAFAPAELAERYDRFATLRRELRERRYRVGLFRRLQCKAVALTRMLRSWMRRGRALFMTLLMGHWSENLSEMLEGETLWTLAAIMTHIGNNWAIPAI